MMLTKTYRSSQATADEGHVRGWKELFDTSTPRKMVGQQVSRRRPTVACDHASKAQL